MACARQGASCITPRLRLRFHCEDARPEEFRGDDFSIANGIDELGAVLSLAHDAAMACAVLLKRYEAAVVHNANIAGQRLAARQTAALKIISENRLGSMSFGEILHYP